MRSSAIDLFGENAETRQICWCSSQAADNLSWIPLRAVA
jgi:hypothetical protein